MLDLTPIDRINVSTAGGNRNANVYLVNMYLPNNLVIQRLRVAEGCLMDELLIGMDIISKGDFAVTNLDGNTYMSFQFPSTRHIDFVKEVQ